MMAPANASTPSKQDKSTRSSSSASTSDGRQPLMNGITGAGSSNKASTSSSGHPSADATSAAHANAMQLAHIWPQAAPAFYDNLKAQLDQRQPQPGAVGGAEAQDPWAAASNGTIGNVPFLANAAMAPQQAAMSGSAAMTASSNVVPDTTSSDTPSMISNSRPTTAQIPTHIVKNNPFLNKLRSMVDDVKTNDLIRWTPEGDTFIVPNVLRFSEEVLPRFFKHNRFSSFVRQLNMYGFHKVPHLQQGALKTDPGQDTELWEFRNDNFKRDHPELLLQMQRKKGTRSDDDKGRGRESEVADDDGTLDPVTGALTRTGHADQEIGTMHMASVWNAIQAVQQAQQGINDNLRHLHNSNAELYREAAEQRARSKKQEETINKMLRFLAGIFGAPDTEGIAGNERRSTQSTSTHNDAADRNRRVFLRPYSKGRNRLMIEHGNGSSGDAEELELPSASGDDVFGDDDLTPKGRITEARSNSSSPKEGLSPKSRFRNLSGTPEQRPDVISTPGGSNRRISQQAQQQILQALSRGDAQQWLASLFGQQQQQQQQAGGVPPSPRMRTDGGDNAPFKLDAQMLANLQSLFGGQGTHSANANEDGSSYFGPNASSNMGAGTGADWSNPVFANPSSAIASQNADQNRIAVLGQNSNNLQNVSQDANSVQQAVQQLVQGLQLTPGGSLPPLGDHSVPPSSDLPSSMAPEASSTGFPPQSNDLDMDSLLKEFLNAPSSGDGTSMPTPGDNLDDYDALISGDTPSFAFSPKMEPSGTGVFDSDPSIAMRRGTGSTSTRNTSSTNTPRDSPPHSSRKRKPMLADDDGDIEMPQTKTKATK